MSGFVFRRQSPGAEREPEAPVEPPFLTSDFFPPDLLACATTLALALPAASASDELLPFLFASTTDSVHLPQRLGFHPWRS